MLVKNKRWKTARMAVLLLLVLCSATVVIVWAASKNSFHRLAQKTNEAKERSVEKLEVHRQRLARLRSIHMQASARIEIYGDNPKSGTGSYEYWAAGKLYKIRCHTDPELGFAPDIDMAYDGKRFYFLDRGSAMLSYRQLDEAKSPVALPNPLFLPLDFLSDDDDDCLFCALRLPDLASQSERWRLRQEGLAVKSTGKNTINGLTETELEMPGGVLDKRAFKLRVRMLEGLDGTARPLRIDRVGADGKLLTSLTFDDFAESGLANWPRSMTVEGFDESSNLMMRLSYSVKLLDVDQRIEPGTFAIGLDEAEGVWDSDEKRFLKEKRPKLKAN
jgi:hypothetical protein